jgi:ribulose-5-phosphate 4-epimerase/fuculose-1-phosphate aldolase
VNPSVEGVIKFTTRHTTAELPRDVDFRALNGWRSVLFRLRLIGQDPSRYDGAGYGNVSQRLPPYPGERGRRRFLVTCTQTGGIERLHAGHYCVVSQYAADENAVTSSGPCLPSSETMTHGTIYDLSPAIRVVLHVHAPEPWHARARLRLPSTSESAPYGTPEMAREVVRLWQHGTLQDRRVLAMAGHEDGIIAFGRDATEAGSALIGACAAALGA